MDLPKKGAREIRVILYTKDLSTVARYRSG
jgi:hypothetical protein